MNKKELRTIYLGKRKNFSVEECQAMSRSITAHFFNCNEFQLLKPLFLHLFLPIKNKNEVDTFFILEEILKKRPNITLALSKSNFEDCSMQLFEHDSNAELIENSYGIPEAQGGKLINPEQLDMVLVPMLVVDEAGNRIGYGKGFYDRLLAKCRKDCKKIGLSFEKPIAKIVPDEYDIPLDYCITPDKVYYFGKE